MTRRLVVHVDGCDDTTTVEIDVTPKQAEFLRQFAAQVKAAAEVGCQPTIRIEETT